MERALDPMTPNGETRAGFWNKAQEIVFRDLPAIRKAVKAETREILEGRT
jgi:hypothetical protein